MKKLACLIPALFLSFGSLPATADSNFDTGKISECPAISAALSTIAKNAGGDAATIIRKVQSGFNSGASQAVCSLATQSTDADFWVDYYRVKINTKKKHVHARIKPKAGPTIKIDFNY